MAQESLITDINEWLVDQALGEPDIRSMFNSTCQRLHAIGVPVQRARLSWPTLHPLFRAETVLWVRGAIGEMEYFQHQDQRSEEFARSPMGYMLENGINLFRRRLEGSEAVLDYPVVKELAEQGFTDYLTITTGFDNPGATLAPERQGIIVTWATDRPGGFAESDLAALERIQRRFAVACKTAIQARIARNITSTYLGRHAGSQVMNGSIRLGDGQETNAIVWFSDLRSSTRLADTMPSAEFLKLLNVYFECAATPVIEAGGEILAFIGDAVLAIFPIEHERDLPALAEKVLAAVEGSLARADQVNSERRSAGLEQIRYGIGLNIGTVMFGNIGVPARLSFSAIGPTVIEVARIEKLTKTLGSRVLATRDIAGLAPNHWSSIGLHRLEGVREPAELFGFVDRAAAQAA